jgi:hypothetical protein
MKLTDAPFETLCKMNKTYYFDKNKIEEFEQFEIQLNDFINAGATFYIEQIIETKKLVEKYNGIKIEIYPNDHVPPHFHIVSNGNNASLAIDDCRVLENSGFSTKVIKNIQNWFLHSKDRLIEVWNETRSSNCVVGRI